MWSKLSSLTPQLWGRSHKLSEPQEVKMFSRIWNWSFITTSHIQKCQLFSSLPLSSSLLLVPNKRLVMIIFFHSVIGKSCSVAGISILSISRQGFKSQMCNLLAVQASQMSEACLASKKWSCNRHLELLLMMTGRGKNTKKQKKIPGLPCHSCWKHYSPFDFNHYFE